MERFKDIGRNSLTDVQMRKDKGTFTSLLLVPPPLSPEQVIERMCELDDEAQRYLLRRVTEPLR